MKSSASQQAVGSGANQGTAVLTVDIGGTFTDLILLDRSGQIAVRKVLTSSDYVAGVLRGIDEIGPNLSASPAELRRFVHGTTIATNAIIEQTGPTVSLLTTDGFRDVLEIGRIRTPRLYDRTWVKPRPLVPRRRRYSVVERIAADGSVVTPVDESSLPSIAERIRAANTDAIAICFLNSYVNDAHERIASARLSEMVGGIPISVSSDLVPAIGEYERTSTTVVNAYLQPVVSRYLAELQRGVHDAGISCPMLVMQSNGGMMTMAAACDAPVHLVESGPAAVVTGGAMCAEDLGLENAMVLDMGGTTAKSALIEQGQPRYAEELELRPGVTLPGRFHTGGGYVVQTPAIELAEVGAGGGSIAFVDGGGALQVGPRSAGAAPGPVCYGLGGTQPTVTDANLILGFIAPDFLATQSMEVDLKGATAAVADHIAAPLGVSVEYAAFGVHTVANARMIRAIRHVTSARGFDPRELTLIATGGSGPVHAGLLAKQIGIPRVIVPPFPGLFGACGLMFANVSRHYARSMFALVDDVDINKLRSHGQELVERARRDLGNDGIDASQLSLEPSLALRYAGQRYDLRVAIPDLEAIDEDVLRRADASFHIQHAKLYGRSDPTAKTEIVGLRVRASLPEDFGDLRAALRQAAVQTSSGSQVGERNVYFGPDQGWLATPIVTRSALKTKSVVGPAAIADYGATIVVPPGASAAVDALSNVHIDIAAVS